MKASDIKNKALAEILAFAVFEFTNIVDYLTSKGEIDPGTDTYDAYLKSFGITEQISFGVWVTDTYTLEMSYEERYVTGFQFDIENKAVYVLDDDTDYNEQDPIALRALPTDDIVGLVDVLERMWNNLIKE